MTSRAPPPDGPYIFLACPWTPVGGGMFKVADYLLQAQSLAPPPAPPGVACLRPLDTRGDGSAAASLLVLARALGRLLRGRFDGRLAGVHVNMAERLSLVRKSAIVVGCRALGIPVVLHLHAAQLHRAWPRLPAPARALVRWVFSLPACCIVLGRNAVDFVTRELRVPPSRIEVVINGVPEPELARRRPAGRLRLLFVGNLSERKGVAELLEAMALPWLACLDLELTLAGGGDLERWRGLAHRLGLGSRVRFEGWADQRRVALLLSQADALVLPSYDEGLPLAILEALAQGVAVVCTPVGEIPQVLTDGREACFVTPGDALGLGRCLARVLTDAALRESLERNGRALWRERFDLAHFFDRIAAIHVRHFGVAAVRASAIGAPEEMRRIHEESIG